MSLVVDASMSIASLFDDGPTDTAHAIMMRVVTEGAIVPSLWRLEVANVLRNAVRRRRCDEDYVGRSLERLGRLRIVIDDQTDERAWSDTRPLSRTHDLTLYDAAHLELALRTARPLGTCDAHLIVAARHCGVDVLTA